MNAPPSCSQSILLANEPRVYRQVLAAALRVRRADVDVIVVEPEALDASVLHYRPALVVCNHLTDVVRMEVPDWVLLYPDGARLVLTNIGGKQTRSADLELDALVTLIDQIDTPCAR